MNTTSNLMSTSSVLTPVDHWDHVLARWGYRREDHRVTPGLYALGQPGPASPVLVTANYTLSFDALRSALPGVDAYILALDTHGINVWCAAGKGTFGTDELVHRVEAVGLADVVEHRKLILPQLGAPGVAAHEVEKRSGFTLEYGPVRAADLPAYLETYHATPEMRRVTFPLRDRAALVPVELVHVILPLGLVGALLLLLVGPLAALGAIAAVLAGAVWFPLLLPWLPTRDFSSKGFILGGLVALPFAGLAARKMRGKRWQRLGWPLTYLLSLPPVTAFLALNFTGATTFTSRSGVKREIATYIRAMAAMFGSGLLLALVLTATRWLRRKS